MYIINFIPFETVLRTRSEPAKSTINNLDRKHLVRPPSLLLLLLSFCLETEPLTLPSFCVEVFNFPRCKETKRKKKEFYKYKCNRV